MAYGRDPWTIEDWPSVWVHRTLAVLEPVEEPPPFGALSQPEPAGVPDETAPA